MNCNMCGPSHVGLRHAGCRLKRASLLMSEDSCWPELSKGPFQHAKIYLQKKELAEKTLEHSRNECFPQD